MMMLLCTFGLVARQQETEKKQYVLAIHGGAGTILRSVMSPEKEAAYEEALSKALQTGYAILQNGGAALDAVEATVHVLEDSPLFNAAKGAVFTNKGRNELDASIMDGRTLNAGAVAGVTNVRNPITAARAVMEKSEHVMLSGQGAEEFAQQAGLTLVDPSYFYTQDRWDALQRALKKDSLALGAKADDRQAAKIGTVNRDDKFGTVGCVALDQQGNLAAGTSTGGMTNKKFGRIGDSPVIGAGTYANNESVAISCTGWGEFYIRHVVAHDIAALMSYKGLPVEEAATEVMDKVADAGGDGGLIALDKDGNIAMPFNTEGMYRGVIDQQGNIEVKIYKD